ISSNGRLPNAISARFGVPNRLVTSGKSAPRTLVNRSAGPPAAIARRWISGTSSRASTGASTTARSPSRRNRSRKTRRSGRVGSRMGSESVAEPGLCWPPLLIHPDRDRIRWIATPFGPDPIVHKLRERAGKLFAIYWRPDFRAPLKSRHPRSIPAVQFRLALPSRPYRQKRTGSHDYLRVGFGDNQGQFEEFWPAKQSGAPLFQRSRHDCDRSRVIGS